MERVCKSGGKDVADLLTGGTETVATGAMVTMQRGEVGSGKGGTSSGCWRRSEVNTGRPHSGSSCVGGPERSGEPVSDGEELNGDGEYTGEWVTSGLRYRSGFAAK